MLISGGDPLVLSDDKLEEILARVRAIDHVEIVRIGSRVPVVCPQRITPELCAMLKKYHPLYLNTHFNHPKEFTPESVKACAMLADAGIPLGNQTVLMRGVNDCANVMKRVCHKLVAARVKPYYFYQCDLAEGTAHFRTSVAKGIEIAESLRGHTTGFAVPTYIIDAVGGGGKTPVMPQYMISQAPGEVILRNYEGVISKYTRARRLRRPRVPLPRLRGAPPAPRRGRHVRRPRPHAERGLGRAPEEDRRPQGAHAGLGAHEVAHA